MNEQSQEKVKEYSNLNKYYLKISLTEQNFSIIVLNTENLDNSLYQFNITAEEFEQNRSKYKNKSLIELYDKTNNLIEKGKYLINDNKECLSLSLFEGEIFDKNKDIQFSLNKSNAQNSETYQNALITIIKNLKKECNNAKNKIEELKIDKQINNEKNKNIKEGELEIHNKTINNLELDLQNRKLKIRRGININTLPKNDYLLETSSTLINSISGYGGNSYNVIKRKYNENRIKIITDYKLDKQVKNKDDKIINPKINYFAIYDGHGGEKCCNFLNEHLHNYIFSSEFFPLYTIKAIDKAYVEAENSFFETVVDSQNGKLLDSSGSCAISTLIIDEFCFVINLGDGRALYSYDSGNHFLQVTRDHLPNDPIEKNRIEKAGGKIYKQDKIAIKGEIIKIDEDKFLPKIKILYRIIPGNISVRK